MDDREKLLDLMIEAKKHDPETAPWSEWLADHLIAHGVTVQRWIPVTERLPTPYMPVLTYRQSLHNASPVMVLEHLTIGYDEEKMWAGDLKTWKNHVTHWMPLPAPPKEEQK